MENENTDHHSDNWNIDKAVRSRYNSNSSDILDSTVFLAKRLTWRKQRNVNEKERFQSVTNCHQEKGGIKKCRE